MRLVRNVPLVALALVCSASCDAADTTKVVAPAAGQNAPAAAAPAAGPAAAQPGFAMGRVLRTDGKPIGIPGTKVQVIVRGVSDAGEKVQYIPAVGADGAWKAKLAPGTYRAPKATMVVPYDDKPYEYNLVPDADGGDFASTDGLVRDFTWRVSGPVPTVIEHDPERGDHYFGASAGLQFMGSPRGTDKPRVKDLGPKGTRVVFTATPVGRLIDGTEGKPRVFDLGWDSLLAKARPSYLHDLPVGHYTVTGKAVAPGGAETPLILQMQTSGDPKPYGPSIDLAFKTGRNGGAPSSLTIFFSRAP